MSSSDEEYDFDQAEKDATMVDFQARVLPMDDDGDDRATGEVAIADVE